MKFRFIHLLIILLSFGATSQVLAQENTVTTCSDNLDNDSDGLTDCDDPDCGGANPNLTPCFCPPSQILWFLDTDKNLSWYNARTGVSRVVGRREVVTDQNRNPVQTNLLDSYFDLTWARDGNLYCIANMVIDPENDNLYVDSISRVPVTNGNAFVEPQFALSQTITVPTGNSLATDFDGGLIYANWLRINGVVTLRIVKVYPAGTPLGNPSPTPPPGNSIIMYELPVSVVGNTAGDIFFYNGLAYLTTNLGLLEFNPRTTTTQFQNTSPTTWRVIRNSNVANSPAITANANGEVYFTRNDTLFTLNMQTNASTFVRKLTFRPYGASLYGEWNVCNYNATLTSNAVRVCSNTSATLSANVTGSAPNAVYRWTNSAGTTSTGSNSFTALLPGNYTLTITDDNCCTTTHSISVPGSTLAISSVTATNVRCFGQSTGAVDLTITGTPSGTLTYRWSNGATTQDISGVSIGVYSVTVSDQSGCSFTNSATVTQPTATLTAGVCSTPDRCQIAAGSIQIQAIGGTSPYTVALSPTATPATTQTIPASGGNTTFTGLRGGTNYSVIVTDSNGCIAP